MRAMAVPEFEEFHLPVLKQCADGLEKRPRQMSETMTDEFQLSVEDRGELLPSGTQTRLQNRVNWALYDLFRAGLLTRPARGRYTISDEGKKVLSEAPPNIDREYLKKFDAFVEFQNANRKASNQGKASAPAKHHHDLTAEERIDEGFGELRGNLVAELRETMAKMDPYRFERLVVDLLFAMGYGGSREEAAQVTQRSNDHGIDGVINQDRLGLDVVYVQAKRWKDAVGRKEIQSFVGALAGRQATKGIFITTSGFRETAREYANGLTQKVILVDGPRLAELMIEHDVGVSEHRTLEIKRIDSDYFEDD